MERIVPCLWYNGTAEEAARFYTSLLPNSHIDRVTKSPTDYPNGKAGDVLTVDFTLDGRKYVGLNGGPEFPFTEAVSFQIMCDDQSEVDRLWAALTNGGTEVQCGWLKDRWGLSWQIVPTRLVELLNCKNPAHAKKAMEAMMQMIKIDIAQLEAAVAE
jgi:predicted 3-demethylubiquinone-9 3-methyltransferase (glyoxalase superfamily)